LPIWHLFVIYSDCSGTEYFFRGGPGAPGGDPGYGTIKGTSGLQLFAYDVGPTLVPHSYCDVCQDVLRFICSSCSMYTDERIHAYCLNVDFQNNNNIWKSVRILDSSQILLNDCYNYFQNQLNEETKYNSINLSTSYIDSIFESVRLVNRYWRKIFTIGIYTWYNLVTFWFFSNSRYYLGNEP
jgi:hypothetical protein